MKSIITLYYNCLIEEDKNFLLDNNGVQAVETYLSTLTKSVIQDFQYIKHGKSISIKIDASQVGLNMGDNAPDLNYCKIQNGTDNPCYYFIINKVWRSKETIELILSMDTLNTYKYDQDYIINKKTLIKRQHKDRFTSLGACTYHLSVVAKDEAQTIDFTTTEFAHSLPYDIVIFSDPIYSPAITASTTTIDGIRYIRLNVPASENEGDTYNLTIFYKVKALLSIIDLKSEEINVPVYKRRDAVLRDGKGNSFIDWALYYKNRNDQDNAPVDCYLTADQPIKFKTPAASRFITVADIADGQILFIAPSYNGELSFMINSLVLQVRYEVVESGYDTYDYYYCLGFENQNGVLVAHRYVYYRDQAWSEIHLVSDTLTINPTIEFLGSQDTIDGYLGSSIADTYLNDFPQTNSSLTFAPSSVIELNTKDTIDKTLSTNLKIINIPYCPSEANIDENDILTISPLWTYDSNNKFLRLTDLSAKFSHEVITDLENFIGEFIVNYNQVANLEEDFNRTFVDPKLKHSDYYRPKFIYDSFSKIFQMELISYSQSSKDLEFKFDFVMSRNMVSKFLFKFNQVTYHLSNSDYDNIVAVSRNNEEVLYNSAYLNYIRTGYNYDLKSKERTESAAGIGIGLNVASLIASIGIGAITGSPVALGSAVASGISLSSQLVSYAKMTAQNEENIQKKLQETQMQAVSVMNADDYDLLYAYSENKAKFAYYECSLQMKNILDDLFFYCGYVINEQGKPDTNSRRSFNFVQASLVIDHSNNLTKEILEDIKEKFENGVTFLHYSFNKFDFNQDKENLERSLL